MVLREHSSKASCLLPLHHIAKRTSLIPVNTCPEKDPIRLAAATTITTRAKHISRKWIATVTTWAIGEKRKGIRKGGGGGMEDILKAKRKVKVKKRNGQKT